MSIIVPAGNKTVNWSPKEETKKVVTASAGAPEVQEEVSPLYLAAKKFDEAKKTAGLSDMGGSSASAGSSGSSGSTSAVAPAGSSSSKSASGAKCPECGKSTSSAAPAAAPAALKDSTEPVIEFDTDDGSSTLIGGEGASDDKGSSENLAGAVEELAEAVLDLKDAVQTDAPAAVDGIGGAPECNDIGGMESPKSIEVEVKKDDGMGAMDIPGTDVGHSEIVKESNPGELCACAASKSSKLPWEKSDAKSGAKSDCKSSSAKSSSDTKAATEVGMDKKAAQSAASSSSDSKSSSSKSSSDTKAATEVGIDKAAKSEEFIKVAMLSPSNRKKLADYWVNMLGFPKDYVGLMVKDYEK